MFLPLIKTCLQFHSFYIFKKTLPNTRIILLRDVFIPKLLNNPLGSRSLINLDFLLFRTACFNESIILVFFVFTTFRFLVSDFFLHFKQYDNVVLYID